MGQYIHLLGNSYINLFCLMWCSLPVSWNLLIMHMIKFAGFYYNPMRSYSFSAEGIINDEEPVGL